MAADEPLFFENFDLESIVTPVKAQHFVQLLKHSNYNPKEVQFLKRDFIDGFDIGNEGPVDHASTSSNLPLRVGNCTILWNKLMKEVKLGRVAGPFKSVPFENFIQSPIGLVPKKGEDQTRLIFHLSYTFPNGKSVNELIPQSKCKVVYWDLDFPVKLCLLLRGNTNQPIFMGKTDAQSAFRILPLSRASWQWVIMKAINPVTRTLFYFVDKCLPFGASISCSHFQRVSDAIKYLLEFRTKIFNCICNYLDDFLFLALMKAMCDYLIKQFLLLCEEIGVPVAIQKTEWGTTIIVFLGVLMDGTHMTLAVPIEKCNQAMAWLKLMLDSKKAAVKQLQTLCSFLNFLSKAIFPGQAFTRRMYAKFSMVCPGPFTQNQLSPYTFAGKLKQHHHVRLDKEFKLDCEIWVKFLSEPQYMSAVNRLMIDILSPALTAQQIFFYSDASAAVHLGFGCIFNTHWFSQQWEKGFIEHCRPSIEYLELLALCAGIFTWKKQLQNCRIIVFL